MTASVEEFRILLAKGYTPTQINAMNAAEVKAEVQEATEQGITLETPIRPIYEASETLKSATYDDLVRDNFRLSEELAETKAYCTQYKITTYLFLVLLVTNFLWHMFGS
jgi:hypothetical protein